MEQLLKAKWIWVNEDVTSCNQHAVFRKTFQAQSTDKARIALSADTDFRLYLNDVLVGKDQFPDYPQDKTFTEFELTDFKDGENTLRVEVFYAGEDSSVYAKGEAGLIAAVVFKNRRCMVTDRSWEAAVDVAFTNGPIETVSCQLGFVKEFDANLRSHLAFQPACERAGATDGFVQSLLPRPLPPLVNLGKVVAKLISDRPIERKVVTGTFAQQVAGDVILDDEAFCTGRTLVGDLGRETIGEFYLDIKAHEGTIVDISHGEYLLDGVVHNRIHERNFTDRYICTEGENHYVQPFRRLGCRYVQVTITGPWEGVEVRDFGLWEMGQKLPELSKFETDDPQSAKLYEIAARTLRSCMHNHYEDCPWREQSLYAYDSRMQMFFNYYSYGNYDFARASLDMLGQGLNRDNGYLNLCAPTHYGITIPCFSLVWVDAMLEYYLYSGDKSLLEAYRDQFEFMAEAYVSHRQDGLYVLKKDKTLWDFYEWVDVLGGADPLFKFGSDDRPEYLHALYNIYLYEMLKNLVRIFRSLGDQEKAGNYGELAVELGKNVEQTFWDEGRGCYGSMIMDGHFLPNYHVHTQVVMLKNHLVPKEKVSRVLAALSSGTLASMSLSPLYYYVEAMFEQNADERRNIVALINQTYMKMIDEGATTFYETQDGHAAFDGAGSLCHAWSSIHSYYYGSKVLGIRPLQPGFKVFELKIYGGEFNRASGEVPTPYGKIMVTWEKLEDKLNVTVKYPKGLEMVTDSYPECRLLEVRKQTY